MMKVGLRFAALAIALAAITCGSAQAALTWYDGFAIADPDDGAGIGYAGDPTVLGGQIGGDGAGIGFFDDAGGTPNPWLGVNPMDAAADDSTVAPGSLSRPGQNFPSTGDKTGGGPAVFDCCYTSRTSRDFRTPLQTMDGTVYMSFLVNFGKGNVNDPHYRAIEFWNGKGGNGRVGDPQLTMSLGISSFGNYDDPQNDADGPDPTPGDGGIDNVIANRQLSLKVVGVTTDSGGAIANRNYQLEEHLSYFGQYNDTHAVTLKFDLTTDDAELGGVGDTVSVFLNPTPDQVVEPTPSLVVSGVDINMDAMSSMILFTFTGTVDNPGFMDELRVGMTWGEVALLSNPEPTTLGLFGLGVVGLLLGARKRS